MAMPDEPAHRMGVFKRLNDVPDRYRLSNHEAAYAGRDVWTEFAETLPFDSKRYHQRVAKAGQSWKDHMDERGRHHALARPDDVDAWCESLLGRLTVGFAYQDYWVRLEQFYSWLQYHTTHPHVYHPVLIAADQYDSAGRIWAFKLSKRSDTEQRRQDRDDDNNRGDSL